MASKIIKGKISLTQAELFKNNITLDLDDAHLDLHNDYECIRLVYNRTYNEFRLTFKRVTLETDVNYNQVDVVFIDAVIDTCLFVFDEDVSDKFRTIDLLYRGRFENGDKLAEFDGSGRSLYYISFYSGLELKVFAKALEVEL
ncbi:hypothetical protein ACLCDV_19185 [Sphingobacterium sp. Lzh-3]|uniref:hypothetical protein n=1 Tax=Sphingobacterium TaxID=28453 RepID=UPI0029530AB9|nr:hypothetical protein [Sphingobacterium sp. UGAL515B_05]WON92498.1 hypothetical protein OK025_14745 [Sphingobacterium sp. UGAL515B_05]